MLCILAETKSLVLFCWINENLWCPLTETLSPVTSEFTAGKHMVILETAIQTGILKLKRARESAVPAVKHWAAVSNLWTLVFLGEN